jgi:hypothetical protein
MSYAFVLLALLQSAIAAPEQAVAPKGADLNNYSWIIISAMGGFILTLGGVIAKLYKDLQKCQDERKKFTEDQLGLLRTLRNEFDKP